MYEQIWYSFYLAQNAQHFPKNIKVSRSMLNQSFFSTTKKQTSLILFVEATPPVAAAITVNDWIEDSFVTPLCLKRAPTPHHLMEVSTLQYKHYTRTGNQYRAKVFKGFPFREPLMSSKCTAACSRYYNGFGRQLNWTIVICIS